MEKLKAKEPGIRRALDERGRHDATVHWSYFDDGSGNGVFRLLAAEDRNDCIVQVSPLNLMLEQERLNQMLVEGKRACADVSHENGSVDQ